ncbi:MAG: proline--tRNA ligase [Candidatus Latescibacterota bacterium]|nr:MAG: proline--tRNA ligase [Candidatus Latescibacterota bacterium]
MRWSRSLIPTFREVPADAEIVSHQLMLRAGLVRKLAAGIFTYLPLGWRSISRVATIVREEMNRAGAQEINMPVLQPAEIWQESGRWSDFGRELMRLRDRHERDFALGPTHEEVITSLVRNTLRSYRQLPQNLYQIQVKFRDEIRPRFGVMRAREFVMKDAYSFHVDDESLDHTYRDMHDAYSRIIERCGLDFRVVEADTGVIGGAESHEFMVLATNGESEILSCSTCGYAANAERAELRLPQTGSEATSTTPEEVSTPGKRTVEEVSGFLGLQPSALAKTLLFKVGERDVAVLVPGSRDLNEAKLARLAGTPILRMLEDAEVRKLSGADVGFAGPVGLPPQTAIWADRSLEGERDFVTGANRTDAHLRGVRPQRDFQVERWGDLVLARAGDTCPRCDGRFESSRGIEVGHIFKLGTKYSEKMSAAFLDDGGRERPYVMGCYGFGVSRTVASAIEQNYDDDGIRWPRAVAPVDVLIVPVNVTAPAIREVAETLHEELSAAGVEVLLDDRDLRPGAKFKDADLIGIPTRVTIGERGLREDKLEIRNRRTGEVQVHPRSELAGAVLESLRRENAD